jgi:hypothetical protein
MDIKQAQKILQQAEAAKKVVARHRDQQLRNAYRKFAGFSSNEELIEGLQNLVKQPAKAPNKPDRRRRARITSEVVSNINALAKSGHKGSAITRQVEASYATVLKVLKGKYDHVLRNASASAAATKAPTALEAPTVPAKRKRRTNNVKLADLTESEVKIIKKAKSHKDVFKLPKGTKNGGKNVMYAVFASVKNLEMRKGRKK